jgi:hypothetical protein
MFTETFGDDGAATRSQPAPEPSTRACQPGTSWLSWSSVAWAEEDDGDIPPSANS